MQKLETVTYKHYEKCENEQLPNHVFNRQTFVTVFCG